MGSTRALPGAAALGLALGFGGACVTGGAFACTDDASCRQGDIAGACEASGYCSFPDPACESGARYSRFAPSALARECTADGATSTESTETSTTSTSTADASTGIPADLGLPAARLPHDVTCGDGLVEAEEACDDGNLADADGCNHDCVVSGTPLWTVIENGPAGGDDYAYAVALLPSGDIVATGRSAGDAGDVWMARFDPTSGENLRAWQYGTSLADEGRAITTDADANIYVVGTATTVNSAANIFVRVYYDALLDGGIPAGNVELVWTRTMNSAMAADDQGYAVAMRESHDEVVVGGLFGHYDDPEHPDAHARGFPLTGELATWTNSAGIDALGNEIRATTVAGDGRVFVGGVVRTANNNARTDAWIGEIDLADPIGTVGFSWTTRIGALATTDVVHAMTSMPSGDLAIAGHLGGLAFWGIWSTEGTELARTEAAGPDTSEIHGIAADSTGAIVTAGFRSTPAGMRDIEVIKYDPAGDVLWTDLVDGPAHTDDRARAVVIADDDTIIVAGHTRAPASDSDIWLRKYAP